MNVSLYYACNYGNMEAARIAIRNGADVDFESDCYTCLGLAGRCNSLKIMELLLRSGANVNKQDELSTTPIYDAVMSGNECAIALLVYYGADLSKKDRNNRTAYDFAICHCSLFSYENGLRIAEILKYCRDDRSSLFSLLPPEIIREIHWKILEKL